MNNKRGGVGAKILLVLILMIASAIGGGYGFRVLDGKLAVREAQKIVEDVEIADYDTEEAAQVQVYLNDVTKDLETAATRKEVHEIMDEFKDEISKVQTKTEKELEAAKREAEEARKANQNQSQDNNANNGYNSGSQDQQSTTQDGSSGYKSNNLTDADDGTEESSGGLLNNLFGGGSNGD